ncbi:MAG TPA: biotin/lipoyl-containing protein, partial [Candidatus Polarisedimenticolaceae bacterium]|nr:biotin/lipoyl-containing protein [Candidatus Polarisedimenticolaceae bacterium]
MAIDIKVPTVGESITEVTLAKWHKKDGEWVNRDEVIAELESEKATFEINAEQAGALKIIAAEGATVHIGDVVCSIDTEATKPETAPVAEAAPVAEPVKDIPKAKAAPKKEEVPQQQTTNDKPQTANKPQTDIKATPVAAAIIADKNVDIKELTPTGSNGKIVKQDVMEALNNPGRKPGTVLFARNERLEKMSNLRKTISRRLVEAKNTTAMLTTFNEVDMSRIME